MEGVLRQKFAAEERTKIRKFRQECAAEYKAELSKKDSQYEALLAKERQQVSKANVKLAQMELSLESLQ